MEHRQSIKAVVVLMLLVLSARDRAAEHFAMPGDPAERAFIETDWRMQDGIDTPRQPATYSEAIVKAIDRGDRLIAGVDSKQDDLVALVSSWNQIKREFGQSDGLSPQALQGLWHRVHTARRQILLTTALPRAGPIAFIKHVPSIFSHQLTQYYGSCARTGGGVFVLEAPGRSMRVRELAPSLPRGSFQHLDVSFDGRRILFSYCSVPTDPKNREQHPDRFFHLYQVNADGTNLKQLTSGNHDDFSPRFLPDGKILFVSTRRGGFHRCGRGPCPVYTLAVAEADGSSPRVISYHETHEWDPALLNDGRVVYTRWDYVDRNAVHYQQLWSARPDGSSVQIYFGNNTLNPVGIWEPRAIPGSPKIIATAAAHHAMTAGSIILLDTRQGVDGDKAIARLTPDALFPESEAPVLREAGKPGAWHAPAGVTEKIAVPVEALRWPGHCYRSPWPISESLFLAAYSFDPLIGEPNANRPEMFGLYVVDVHGNKELLYRNEKVSSLWPMPLAPRLAPPALPNGGPSQEKREGTFFVQNIRTAWPSLPDVAIRQLRVLQVLPKSTPHINSPTVGLASASPGKQVLGTVPVEEDGSAYFRAPAGIPLSFQALDEQGQAVQIMRSLTYLQPGEQATCIGCHEHRTTAPAAGQRPSALSREPSVIRPGPDGSNPLSYPLLVQPVLDARCVSCHHSKKPEGGVILTGEPQGSFSRSYNELVKRVPFAAWGNGLSMAANSEPLTRPDHFGARGSKLMKALLAGHYDVKLTPDEIERLVTWMDANALFYGTFDEKDQARQRRGERIEGPKIE